MLFHAADYQLARRLTPILQPLLYPGVSLTGSGTIAFGGFTLTVPATGTAALGTGAAGRIGFWSGTNTITSSANLLWDDTNKRLGVGTTPNASAMAHFHQSIDGPVGLFVTNNSTAGGASVGIRAGLDPGSFGTDYMSLGILGTNFPTIGILKAKTGLVECYGTNFTLSNYNDTESIQFATTTSRSLRWSILAGGALEGYEITAPAAGATNSGRVFFRDNGSGKTQYCVIFATGAVQVLATEP